MDLPRTAVASVRGSPSAPPRPAAQRERFGYLDFLRGVALLGIVPENIPYFAYPVILADLEPVRADGPWYDLSAMYLVRVLGDYSFLTLFALLFGVGLGLIHQRCAARGEPFGPLYLRRLRVLLMFGVLHAALLWYGDILVFFAVGGAAAMTMAGWSTRALWRTGVAFISLPLLVMLLGAAVLGLSPAESRGLSPAESSALGESRASGAAPLALPQTLPAPDGERGRPARTGASPSGLRGREARASRPQSPLPDGRGLDRARSLPATGRGGDGALRRLLQRYLHPENETRHYREGPLSQMLVGRFITWCYTIVYMMLYMEWRIIGLFLIGMALVRDRWFLRPESHPSAALGTGVRPFQRLLHRGLLAGIPLHAAFLVYPLVGPLNDAGKLLMESFKYAGSLGMAAAYAAIAALVYVKARDRWWVRPILATGRSTLTAYILSSVVMGLLFYFYGLAWFNRLGRAQVLALVPVVWLVCLVFCSLWLSRFPFGPLEWIWRRLTYGGTDSQPTTQVVGSTPHSRAGFVLVRDSPLGLNRDCS